MPNPLTHFNNDGRARMVDVSAKNITERTAIASGQVYLKSQTMQLIKERNIKKGDVLAVAQVAGIMAAKNTSNLIPMCHPLLLTNVDISFNEKHEPDPKTGLCCIHISATVKVTGQTGVEMEALCGVSLACLTVYDMCKSIDRNIIIRDIKLLKKTGGKTKF